MKPQPIHAFAVVAATVALVGPGAQASGSTRAPATDSLVRGNPHALAGVASPPGGTYAGTTSQGQGISIQLEEDTITLFTVTQIPQSCPPSDVNLTGGGFVTLD